MNLDENIYEYSKSDLLQILIDNGVIEENIIDITDLDCYDDGGLDIYVIEYEIKRDDRSKSLRHRHIEIPNFITHIREYKLNRLL